MTRTFTLLCVATGSVGHSESFHYDLSSNIVDQSDSNNQYDTTFTYNGDDQLTVQDNNFGNGGTQTTYTYDANGSQTEVMTDDGDADFTYTYYGYDVRNKMVSIGNGGTPNATYVYDDAGNRPLSGM